MRLSTLLRLARLQGWTVKHTLGGHYKLFAPDGEGLVVVGRNLGGPRAIKNVVAELKRHGMKFDIKETT